MELYETRGGLNHQTGRLEESHTQLADSTLETRFSDDEGQLILNQLTTEQTTPDDGAGSTYLSSASFAGKFVVATTDYTTVTASPFLTETSLTDPTLVSIAFTVGASNYVHGLYPVRIGGTSYLAVACTNAVSLMNTSLALFGTMSALTSQCHGIIVNPFGDVLLHCGPQILNLPAGSATSDAPDVVISNLPAGGWAMGLASLAGAPIRAWWNWPHNDGGSFAIDPGNALATDGDYVTYDGAVYSTDFSGNDARELLFPLPHVTHSVIIRDGIAASDSKRIIFHNGRSIRDLKIFTNRPANSDVTYVVAGLYVRNNDLFVEVNLVANNGVDPTIRWIEAYDFDWNGWHQVTRAVTLTNDGIRTYAAPGSLPVSPFTGNLHTRADGSWWRVFQPPAGVNPFSLRQSEGADGGVEFEASGITTWAAMNLPGMAGWPSVISSINMMGDLDAGSSDCSVTVYAGDIQANGLVQSYEQVTFTPGLTRRVQRVPVQSSGYFFKLGVAISILRGSNTHRTPNALPIQIEGYTFVDAPQDVPPFMTAE